MPFCLAKVHIVYDTIVYVQLKQSYAYDLHFAKQHRQSTEIRYGRFGDTKNEMEDVIFENKVTNIFVTEVIELYVAMIGIKDLDNTNALALTLLRTHLLLTLKSPLQQHYHVL